MIKGILFCLMTARAFAGVESSISGSVTDADQAAVRGAKVELIDSSGHAIKSTTTDTTGGFAFFPIEFGTYSVHVSAAGLADKTESVTAASGSPAQVEIHLGKAKELVVNVKAKRNAIQTGTSDSHREITKDDIANLPQGETIALPKLLATTTPGVIQGPFGQMFIRGNHANIQYQIDGVQLPESISGTFGEAFAPRDIDHMEVITGGIPAEYGERMAAVVNIVTKGGPEAAAGQAEANYGTYNTFNPNANYGGSDAGGKFRYFVTASYLQTDRGLDTPEPASYDDQAHGGSDAVHDHAQGHDEFARLDYILDNSNKLSLDLFNSNRHYEIPNFPSSFKSTDDYFGASYNDAFGNQGGAPYVPSGTADSQNEQNSYVEFVWKHTLNDRAFLQVAPYYKRSGLAFNNDPANELAPNGSLQTSFAMNRAVDNLGLKTDYSQRIGDGHLAKAGFQIQQSNASGQFSLQNAVGTAPTVYGTPDRGSLEAAFLQDSWSLAKPLTLNIGLRYSATQFKSDDLNTQDGLLQPRVGLEWMTSDSTKLHVFYGKLFQPAPFEDLRDAVVANGGNAAVPYDIKAEKDDYFEGGVTQSLPGGQSLSATYYYKDAVNMLDDSQLLQTSIAQPYNFARGFAQGIEISLAGQIDANWSDFANYAYEDARGQGQSGGFFLPGADASAPYQFLDHVQLNTANAGLTYRTDAWWATLTGLYGSGLRTRSDNGGALPAHTTFDFTAGYAFRSDDWLARWKVSCDVLNIGDNAYPITIANGYNGNHYAAGREFFVHLIKDL